MKKNLLLALFAVLVAIALCEAALRMLTFRNHNGELQFGPVVLLPYRLPIASLQRSIERIYSGELSRFLYDPQQGWRMRPGFQSADGMYQYEHSGIRRPVDVQKERGANKLRIAMFGDSVTHADDVFYEQSWGYHLEQLLNQRTPAEVLNMGVSAFGIDQAFLHWHDYGQNFSPNVVLFGFQPENVKRNINLVRMLYTHSAESIPFTKPRFELDSEQLQLRNVPTLEPQDLVRVMRGEVRWPLLDIEGFYDPADYSDSLCYLSRLCAFGKSVLLHSNKYSHWRGERALYAFDGEAVRLARAILMRFKGEVEASGAKFMLVHLPRPQHVDQALRGELVYEELLEDLRRNFDMFDLLPLFSDYRERGELAELFGGNGHFSAEGNKVVAEHIAEKLYPAIQVTKGDKHD